MHGPEGALIGRLSVDGADQPSDVVIDTGSSITLFAGGAQGRPEFDRRTFRLLGRSSSDPQGPVRAVFRDVSTLTTSLGRLGRAASALAPGAVLGGDLLRSYSVDLDFAAPAMTLWPRLPAADGFLAAAGLAVLRFQLHGGGEIDALGEPDAFGFRGSLGYPATRVVLRGCAAPAPFSPEQPRAACCLTGAASNRPNQVSAATGTNLALVLTTGVGPIVLGRSAWERVAAGLPPQTPTSEEPLLVPSVSDPIAARWMVLPRLALVDQEADTSLDPGPCVELGRARRLEQVAWAAVNEPGANACVQPCDSDPKIRGSAQNSAAYIELGGMLTVAVIDDTAPLLQALRGDIRPEGPEIDGILGAAALAAVRLEIDYRSAPGRAVFSCQQHSCEAGAARQQCWAAGRCPRLRDADARRACFCLPPHGRPENAICQPAECR